MGFTSRNGAIGLGDDLAMIQALQEAKERERYVTRLVDAFEEHHDHISFSKKKTNIYRVLVHRGVYEKFDHKANEYLRRKDADCDDPRIHKAYESIRLRMCRHAASFLETCENNPTTFKDTHLAFRLYQVVKIMQAHGMPHKVSKTLTDLMVIGKLTHA